MTFKHFRRGGPRAAEKAGRPAPRGKPGLRALQGVLAALGLCVGCHLGDSRMASSDMRQPGWTIRQGQAVWHLGNAGHPLFSPKQAGLAGNKLPAEGVEIAGEVLVARNANGEALVQFAKPPFTLVMGRLTPTQWEVSFPPRNQRFSGPGAPPKQISWLYLPRVLAGMPPPTQWIWREDADGWKLENRITGEFVEGYFSE